MPAPKLVASRYELAEPIGHGAMGEVWRGYDRRLDRPIAVKLLLSERLPFGTTNPAVAERFVRECRVTARLQHAGVPAVYDAGQHGRDLYLVMQLIDGHDLADVIAEQAPLPVADAVAIAAQIASVLAAAHAASLVHRDVKPRNLMLRRDGTVAVLDFGVAALLDASGTRLTRTGETLGTPSYMSPEQATGAPAGPASDLYALGCVLVELLTGHPPFTADNAYALLRKHLEEPPPDLRSLNPDVPEPLAALVAQLLAKRAEDRPADAAQVYERLLRQLPAPGVTGDETPMDPTRPFRRPLAPAPRTLRESRADRTVPNVPDVDVADALRQVGELQDAHRYSQAADLLGRIARQAARDGTAPARLMELRLNLAATLLLGGDYRAALPEYQALVTDLAAQSGTDDELVLHCRRQAAICLAELGENTEAVRLLRDLLPDARRTYGPESQEVFDLRQQIGLTLAASGERAAARRMFEDLLTERARAGGPGGSSTQELREILAHLDDVGVT